MVALKSKISFLEAQLLTEREARRKLQEDLNEAVKATFKAINESDALKSENRALKVEIANLRKQLQESVKPAQPQKATTAKERVKERVDAEKRKHDVWKGRVQNDSDATGDRSFIKVLPSIQS
jgi:regulator of replication initiation timing